MKYSFGRTGWSADDLAYAYTLRFAATPTFIQHDDHIENPPEPANPDGYSYISLITKEKWTPNVKLTTHCSFTDVAAPLVVLPKTLYEKDGKLYYGDYLEVVIWKNGINVWKLWLQADGSVKYHNLLKLETPLAPDVIHNFSVEIRESYFVITLDEHRVTLRCEDIFDSFHLGITGCEGPCRFYDMQIESL